MNTEKMKRAGVLFPEIAMRMGWISKETMCANLGIVMANNLGHTGVNDGPTSDIWKKLSDKYIAMPRKTFAAFDAFMSNLGTVFQGGDTVSTVMVERGTAAGNSYKNLKDWRGKSAIGSDFVPVVVNRISTPFAIKLNELMQGNVLEKHLADVVGKHIESLYGELAIVIAKAVAAGTVSAQAIDLTASNDDDPNATPMANFVAHRLSAIFGDYGAPDTLLLNPEFYARLTPASIVSGGFSPGSYGIGAIYRSAGQNAYNGTVGARDVATGIESITGGTAVGLVTAGDGIVMATGSINFEPLGGAVSVRDLGTVGGVPMQLKSWVEPGQEEINCSIESMLGFAVGNGSLVRVLTPPVAEAAAKD